MHTILVWLAAPAAAARVAIGLLLLRAVWDKSRDPAGFAGIVAGYRLLPERAAWSAAMLLLGGELALGALLLSGLAPGVAGYGAAGLFAMFAGAMAINLRRGRTDISCGCLPASMQHRSLSWRGVAGTGSLMLPALLAAQGWPLADPVTVLQAAFAGLLLVSLHDAAQRLSAPPVARVHR